MLKNQWAFSYTAYDKVDEDGRPLGRVGVPASVDYDELLKTCVIGCLTAVYDSDQTGRVLMPLIRKRQDFGLWLRLLKIVVPGWRSKETRLLASHTFFLILRTLISLRVAEMDGAIVKALVKGRGKEFLQRIVWWMLIAIPATFTNSMV